jgi:hypothetical protein
MAVLAINVIWACRATSPVALVDGWAVLNRIMHFQRGEMTWMQYLFTPHGAHLHAVVYGISWLDYEYFGGAQWLLQWISLGATALFGLFFVRLCLREGARQQASRWMLTLGCAAIMAAVCSLADREIMLHPFQVVLSVSRLTFVLLLYAIIVGMIEERVVLYIVAMVLSMLAVTFHGTGYVFGVCIIVAHVLVSRRVWMGIFSVAPLLTAVILQKTFSQGGDELGKLSQALDMRSLVGIVPGMAAYFATPITTLESSIGTNPLLGIGFVIFCAVTAYTVRAIVGILGIKIWTVSGLWQQLRAARIGPPADPVKVLLAVLGVFLLASGAAATLFWVIRTAVGPQVFPPSYYILTSGRYGSFACLGFVIIIFAMLRSPLLRFDAPGMVFKGGAILVAGSLLFMALYASVLELRVYDQDDQLNIAAAGIMTGLKPTQPEADAVWQQAVSDPHWAKELPMTSEFMRVERKGLWYEMPPMSARGGAFYAGYAIADLIRKPVLSDPAGGRCEINGTIPVNKEFGKIGRVLPVANADGVVVGYAALRRITTSPKLRVVSGFAVCPSGIADTTPLFLAHDMHASTSLALGDPAPSRGGGRLPITPMSDMKGTLRCAVEPATADRGATAILTLINESTFDWTLNVGRRPIGIGVHLLDGKGAQVYWDDGVRVPAERGVIAPHASAVLRMPIAAISLKNAGPERGTLTARFQLVQDGYAWFPGISCDTVVRP